MLLDYGAFEDDTPVFNHPLQTVERACSMLSANGGATNDPFWSLKSDNKPGESGFEPVGAETPNKDSNGSDTTAVKKAIADAGAIKFAEDEDAPGLVAVKAKRAVPKKVNFSCKKPEQTIPTLHEWLTDNGVGSKASANSVGQRHIYPWSTLKEREAAGREANEVAEAYLKANCPATAARLNPPDKRMPLIVAFPGTIAAQAVSDATLTDLKELMPPTLPAPDMSHKEAIKAANDEYQQQADKYEQTKASAREMTEKIHEETAKILAAIRKVSDAKRMDQSQILEKPTCPMAQDLEFSKAEADKFLAAQQVKTARGGLRKREPVNYRIFPPDLDTELMQKTKAKVDALWADPAEEHNYDKKQSDFPAPLSPVNYDFPFPDSACAERLAGVQKPKTGMTVDISKLREDPTEPEFEKKQSDSPPRTLSPINYDFLLPETEWADRLAGVQTKPKTGMAADIGKHREDKAGHVLGMSRLPDYDISRERYDARDGGGIEKVLLDKINAQYGGVNDSNVQRVADSMNAAKKAKKTLGIGQDEPVFTPFKPKQHHTATRSWEDPFGRKPEGEMSALQKSLADMQAKLDKLVKKKEVKKVGKEKEKGLSVMRQPSPAPSNPFDDCNEASEDEYLMVQVDEEEKEA